MSLTALVQQDKQIYLGQTARFLITVVDRDGQRFDLGPTDGPGNSILYLRVKKNLTDANPGIIALESGTGLGIIHLDQTQPLTKGQAEAVMSSAQTAALTNSPYKMDLWLAKTTGEKTPLMQVSQLIVATPVVQGI